jgi:hypothetical protein
MLWAGMPANASPYEEMLQVCLMPQLKDRLWFTNIYWSPHSPDLTTPCSSLWGIMKGQAAANNCDKDDLCRAVAQAFATTAPQMLH